MFPTKAGHYAKCFHVSQLQDRVDLGILRVDKIFKSYFKSKHLGFSEASSPIMGFQGFFARLAQKISKTIPMSDTLGIKEIEETKFPKYILFIHSSLSHQRVAGVCAL